MFQSNAHWKSNQIKSKVLFKVGTFTNSTNLSSRELFKPTCILRYKLQHNKNNKNKPTSILRYKLQHNKIKNKIMSCIKTTYMYQAKIKCKHIYDLISGPPHVASTSLQTDCHRTRKQHRNRCWQLQHILYISKIHNQIGHCPK